MNQKIIMTKNALLKMEKLTAAHPLVENGGLLFGRMNPRWIRIYDVSDAGIDAKRSRAGVVFDAKYLTDYTIKSLEKDLFVIGTWHSHPSFSSMLPSSTDRETMKYIHKKFSDGYTPVFCITKLEQSNFYYKFYSLQNGFPTILDDIHVDEEGEDLIDIR